MSPERRPGLPSRIFRRCRPRPRRRRPNRRSDARVASYNIWNGGTGRVDAIEGVLRSIAADAVALLEVSDVAAAADLARRLDMQLVLGESPGPLGMHIAWLTRLRPRRTQNHPLPQLSKTLLELEVEWAGAPLRLFATHLASRHEEASYPREAEAKAILGVLGRAGTQHLLAGDLNGLHPVDAVGMPPRGIVPFGEAEPGAPRRTLPLFLEAGYVDCFRRLHTDEPGWTYPADAPWLRLDFVLAPPRVAERVSRCEVVLVEPAPTASDHLPVVADLE